MDFETKIRPQGQHDQCAKAIDRQRNREKDLKSVRIPGAPGNAVVLVNKKTDPADCIIKFNNRLRENYKKL